MFKAFLENSSAKNLVLKNIYWLIHQLGPVSKAELLEKTNLTQTTLGRMIAELLKHNWIRECGVMELNSAGRPPILYQIEPKCGYLIGIELTRLKADITLFDLSFQPLERKTFVLTSMHTPSLVIADLQRTIRDFMDKHQIAMEQLLGIGIGTIGVIDREKGMIIDPQPMFAPGWTNVPIVAQLKETFPVKIILENSSHAALLGEYQHVPQYNDVLYCFSGWEMGFGVITNGELIVARKGHRGSYGHMTIEVNGRQCVCGKKGCLVSYTSPYAILQEVIKRHPSIEFTPEKLKKTQFYDIINFLIQEKHITEQVIMESAYYFGVGLANIINVLHSELVILNGPLILQYPNYYEKVVQTTAEQVYEQGKVRFSQGKLQDKAAMAGAAIHLFHSYF